jgi:NAD(P)-dependent dehydrogenase (short-subunit alcohol dehydrogenase family)
MTKTQAGSAIVIGAGSGVGRATVLALAAQGRRVWAAGRDLARLEAVRAEAGAGEVLPRALDATDGAAVDRLLDEADPDLVVLSAGTRPRMAPVPEQTWQSFSAAWNTDVKIAFQVGQTALRKPLRPGSLVIILSSGAGLNGSPLSGGYAGSKRMQMFLAGYLQRAADAAKLGIRFLALVPKQFIAGTEIGEAAARAYAASAGLTRDQLMDRSGAPLTAEAVAATIARIARGELGAEATLLAVTGAGTEPL